MPIEKKYEQLCCLHWQPECQYTNCTYHDKSIHPEKFRYVVVIDPLCYNKDKRISIVSSKSISFYIKQVQIKQMLKGK
jgi:hypothetical protein